MELGSEFNLALSQLSVKSKNIFQYLSGFSYVYYFDSGRSALKHIALHMNDDDEILLPEFICESVTNCFKQKRISFYKLTSDFTVDINDLERKISSDTRLVFLMHYFGKVQPRTVLDRMVAVAKEHGILIIEDTTHSIFTKAHTIGDYQVCSMRKWFPIPKGGVLYSNEDVLSLFSGINYETDTDNRRSYGMVLKDLFLNQGINCNSEYRRIFAECEEKLDQQEKIYMLSDFSRFIASCVDVDELRESRIQNYHQLKTALYNMGVIPAVLLEDGECPFVLPIQINARDSFRSYLMNNQIYCAVHWPFDGIREEVRTFAKDCSNNLISLPIDQRYGKREIGYLANTIQQYGEGLLC